MGASPWMHAERPSNTGAPSAILLTLRLLIKRQGPERHGGAEGRNGAKPAFLEQGQPAHDQWTDPSCKNQSPELTAEVRLNSRQSGEEKARSRGGCGGGAKRIRLAMPTFPSNRTSLVTVPMFPAVWVWPPLFALLPCCSSPGTCPPSCHQPNPSWLYATCVKKLHH